MPLVTCTVSASSWFLALAAGDHEAARLVHGGASSRESAPSSRSFSCPWSAASPPCTRKKTKPGEPTPDASSQGLANFALFYLLLLRERYRPGASRWRKISRRTWPSTPPSASSPHKSWQAYSGRDHAQLPGANGGPGLHLGSGGDGRGSGAHPRLRSPALRPPRQFLGYLTRAVLYVLLPLSLPAALILCSLGGCKRSSLPPDRHPGRRPADDCARAGRFAEPIKLLSSDGGGFFNANSAHPFENPSPVANLLEMLLVLAIPAAFTYTFGRAGSNAARAGRSSRSCSCLRRR